MATTLNTNYIIDVTHDQFQQAVIQQSHTTPVVVDFWAEWCGPCRMLGPILENLAREYQGKFILAKVDVDRNQALAQRYRVQGIPAVKAFYEGEVVGEFTGRNRSRKSAASSKSSYPQSPICTPIKATNGR